jgi:type I restriction enzyme S subunit
MALCDQLETQHNNAAVAHEQLVSQLLATLTLSQNAADFSVNWQRIAAHFDTLFTTESSIDALKQTLLQLAVMGKLVSQDPNDEPASELLKRIQAEKAKLVTEGKIKKDKPFPPITDDEKPFALPKSWVWVRVAEIAELITSGSRDWAQYLSDEGAKFITMGNLSRGGYDLRLENIRYVNPPKTGEGSRTKLEANDLLISITGDVGNLGRIPESFGDAYINQHTCLLRFISQCRNRYFPEVMRSPMAILQFNEPQRGIKNSFRLGDLSEMVIPVPPLDEQNRIVAKVDELMALCDQLKSRITAASQLQQKLADVMVERAVV